MSISTATLTVVCYTRSAQLVEPINAHIEALQGCEDEGHIGTLLVRAWPAELSMADSAPNGEALATFKRFRAWADRVGVSICPPFEQVKRTSTIIDEQQELLRTPLLCLALYVSDQLAAVYPHTDDTYTHSVTDAIAQLQTGEWPAQGAAASLPEPVSLGTCPKCGHPCQTGQGVYVCLSCRWVAGTTATGHYQELSAFRTQEEGPVAQPQLRSEPR